MRIKVKSSDAHFSLIIPTSFICSKLGVKLISRYCIKDKGKLSDIQIREMAAALKKFRKKHRDWVLVDVRSNDGERVLIKL